MGWKIRRIPTENNGVNFLDRIELATASAAQRRRNEKREFEMKKLNCGRAGIWNHLSWFYFLLYFPSGIKEARCTNALVYSLEKSPITKIIHNLTLSFYWRLFSKVELVTSQSHEESTKSDFKLILGGWRSLNGFKLDMSLIFWSDTLNIFIIFRGPN